MSLLTDLDRYLTQRSASDLRPRSVAHHRSMLRRFVQWLTSQGHTRWSTVTAADLDTYLTTLAERRLSVHTMQGTAWTLRVFGQWLLANGLVLRDPTADVRVPDPDEEPLPPAPLSEAQVAALFDHVGHDSVIDLRTRAHLELLYASGLRSAEAVALDVADIDLDARTVLVRDGKGGGTRLLPLLAPALAALGAYLALRRDLLRGPDTGALLLHTTGHRLPAHVMQTWMRRASTALGFRVHPHLLRHSIAVHLLRRVAGIRAIQAFLGHADLDTTKVYLRLVPGHLRADYDAAMPVYPVEPPPVPPATDDPAGASPAVTAGQFGSDPLPGPPAAEAPHHG
jgi:integrase/recombinase XerC